MRVLAIDTALSACAACVMDAGDAEPLSFETIVMERGHAEALLPLVDRVVSKAEGGFSGLDRVAVTVGPGSYTGLRVGIAAARAIGLAAHVPVVGVTTLSAFLAALVADENRRVLAAAIDAKHGQVYFQSIAPGGQSIVAPTLVRTREAARLIGSGPTSLVGSGAAAVGAETAGIDIRVQEKAFPDVLWVARLGMVADPAQALPKPLYLRGPDAKPQDQAGLPRQ
ncbi:MAG TPA: tRNA (adenosine(37)-N6)-threonylcarbamoyltransferase complex dimerization subunit type 1 TsaB [Beijerinckiaceae bacterium]|jgi:tRNA threonylcarbamoyladenosine biosynthesis protein TsaB|nr:tRNA (adenosine(37)-N6)-threonylcarbamoyltransferase complex dimerization subunit type 1 TsaB [Beijerinckiaceae bacterium]